MSNLIKYIFEDKYDKVAVPIDQWLKKSEKFHAFVFKNKNKIRKKIRCASDEFDLEDVVSEIRVAFLILIDEACKLKYEPYGSGDVGPDFQVTYNEHFKLNIEVKHIRRNKYSVLFDRIVDRIRKQVNRISSPYYYGIQINIREYNEDIVRQLEEHSNQIVKFISLKAKDPLSCRINNEIYEYDIEPFGNRLKLLLLASDQNSASIRIKRFPSSTHIPFTMGEFKKISSTIFEKVHQLKNDIPNIILVYNSSYLYDRSDVKRGFEALLDLLSKNDNDFLKGSKYRFSSFDEFKTMFVNLWGLVFVTEHNFPNKIRNYYIKNPLRTKIQNVDTNLLKHLISMKENV